MSGEQDAIWAEMPGGGLLHDLFGYWPTFHDAELKSICFDPATDQLSITVDYLDEPTDGDTDLRALVEIVFSGVQLIDVELRNHDILNLSFKRSGDLLETTIEFSDGSTGKIVSESVDASLSQLNPNRDESKSGTVRLYYSRRA